MSDRAIVLDANILIRAVLGKRVRELIVDNAERVQFFSPIESGRGTPSMRTVQRFAHAVGVRAVVRMEPLTGA